MDLKAVLRSKRTFLQCNRHMARKARIIARATRAAMAVGRCIREENRVEASKWRGEVACVHTVRRYSMEPTGLRSPSRHRLHATKQHLAYLAFPCPQSYTRLVCENKLILQRILLPHLLHAESVRFRMDSMKRCGPGLASNPCSLPKPHCPVQRPS